ncbi:hypothetical protein BDZ97DRAFT_210582 [Flammula alnicola]|nr:hypothetical protein BDZ97DRAFT_210582 [Flammula alnicola]
MSESTSRRPVGHGTGASASPTSKHKDGSTTLKSRVDRTLAVSQTVFNILNDVSQLSTVPGLKEAATIACTLIQMVQTMRSTKQAYRDIVEEVCALLVCIAMHPGEMSESLKADLEYLVGKLNEIKDLCTRLAARHLIGRFFLSGKDAQDLTKIRNSMAFVFNVFYLKSTISIRAIQENWKGGENPQTTQLILEELKSQRALMENSTTYGALAPANASGGSSGPAMQVFEGKHRFEDEVTNTNNGGNGIRAAPLQVYSGEHIFKGKVTNTNNEISFGNTGPAYAPPGAPHHHFMPWTPQQAH